MMLMKQIGRVYMRLALVLMNTVILMLVIEGVAAVIVSTRPATTLQADLQAFKSRMMGLSYYQAQDWADGYWTEHLQADNWVYAPYRLWQTRPFTGQFINVDENGNRLTHASDCNADTYQIYVFGGSTLWGYGVPDWNTIPTGMQIALIEDGVCVVNFGELGYSSTQSLIRLSQLIANGDVPDMVVFYDGTNDIAAANRTSIAGNHFYYEAINSALSSQKFAQADVSLGRGLLNALTHSATYRLIIGDPPKIEPNWALPPLDESFINATAQTYLNNIAMSNSLCEANGCVFHAFIQPVLPVSAREVNDEEQRFLWEMPGGLNELFEAVYPIWEAQAENLDYLTYFGGALDTQTERIWIDFNHITAVGNLAIANDIVAVIRLMITK
jgi:lysophospholipase L1-like esterase